MLLDGAVLSGHPVMASVMAEESAKALYANFGKEAATVGPWLVALQGTALDWLEQLQGDEAVCHAVSVLITSDSRHDKLDLESHLDALRYIHTRQKSGPRYFFRYADTLALSRVWDVLTATQQIALLGPVQSWQWGAQGEKSVILTAPPCHEVPKTSLPLRLNPHQFKQVLDATRADELLAATREWFPENIAQVPTQLQRERAQHVLNWLRIQALTDTSIELVVAAVVIGQGLQLLHNASFEVAVDRAVADHSPSVILDWAVEAPAPAVHEPRHTV